MIITEFLERNARLYGNDSALVEVDSSKKRDGISSTEDTLFVSAACSDTAYRRELSWKEFDIMSNRFANLILSRGAKKGSKVGILLKNCIEFLPIYFGILKAGCVVVPLNYRFSSSEIKYSLDLADIEFFFFGPEFTDRIEAISTEIPGVKFNFFVGNENVPPFAEPCLELIKLCSADAPSVLVDETDHAAIYFSSGTTGLQKAILHSHKALVASCETEQKHHSQVKGDVFLCIPPLYHTGAKMHWFGSLISGGKAIILRGTKPELILRTISEEKCTIVWLLVPWAQDILDDIESGKINLSDYDLKQWRLMHIGAQPVPPTLIKRWLSVFPNHEYDTNYGLSESLGPGCVHLGVGNIDKVSAIGKAGYYWETRIVDENHKDVPKGKVGELAVKGPGVMLEYYKNPEETKSVLEENWLYTGDMVMEDEDGFIYLVDRKKDLINMGGEHLYPIQIEDFLRSYDKIKDVAVIGFPDKRLGEIPCAVIELKCNAVCTEEEINEFCLDLPRYKRPRKIIFADVPRNPTGKIEKTKLRKKFCRESAK